MRKLYRILIPDSYKWHSAQFSKSSRRRFNSCIGGNIKTLILALIILISGCTTVNEASDSYYQMDGTFTSDLTVTVTNPGENGTSWSNNYPEYLFIVDQLGPAFSFDRLVGLAVEDGIYLHSDHLYNTVPDELYIQFFVDGLITSTSGDIAIVARFYDIEHENAEYNHVNLDLAYRNIKQVSN